MFKKIYLDYFSCVFIFIDLFKPPLDPWSAAAADLDYQHTISYRRQVCADVDRLAAYLFYDR